MRPGLRWLLAITVLMSAVALWWPDEPAHPSNLSDTMPQTLPASRDAAVAAPTAAASAALLAATLPRPSLSLNGFDPFVGVVPPMAPTPAPPPAVMRPAPVPAAPAPAAPALSYRYLGRMTDPDGAQRVYLAKGDTAVVVEVGTRLDEGYVVQAVSSESIRLHFAPLDAHAVIPISAQEPAPR